MFELYTRNERQYVNVCIKYVAESSNALLMHVNFYQKSRT